MKILKYSFMLVVLLSLSAVISGCGTYNGNVLETSRTVTETEMLVE